MVAAGGMNQLHLMSVLRQQGIRVEKAVETDFSAVLIEAAKREAKRCLPPDDVDRLKFHAAKNESLVNDLSICLKTERTERSRLEGGFDFIFGVNTIRYCRAIAPEIS